MNDLSYIQSRINRLKPGNGRAISDQDEKSDIPGAMLKYSQMDRKRLKNPDLNREKRSCTGLWGKCAKHTECCSPMKCTYWIGACEYTMGQRA